MPTRTWADANGASFTDPTQWIGMIAPTNGDTALVMTSAGPSPASGSVNGSALYSPAAGESIVYFTTVTPAYYAYPQVVSVSTGITTESTPLYPLNSQIPAGDDIVGETIDMLGQGSATAADFEQTTIGSTSAIDVSGVAIFDDFYNNTLAGTINIGLPVSVGGMAVPTPATDSHGVANEVDLELWGDGSVEESDTTLQTYIPTTDNTGTINIAADSELRIAFDTGPLAGQMLTSTLQVSEFPGRAVLENDRAINVAAGGTLWMPDTVTESNYGAVNSVSDGDATDSTADDDKGVFVWEEFDNTGQINITGAAGQTTTAFLQGVVAGAGTITINGNTSNPGGTALSFEGLVVGQTIVDTSALVTFYDVSDFNFSRAIGGSFTFGDANGTLLIDPSTDVNGQGYGAPGYTVESGGVMSATLDALDQPFGMPISGFRPGDTIEITAAELATLTATFKAVWAQTTNTLTVDEITSLGTVDAAQFMLMGTYSQSQFVLTPTRITTDPVQGGSFSGYAVDIGYVACFASGTRIATPSGERAVEDLCVGDHVVTVDGDAEAITWIGTRRIGLRTHPRPESVRPVRIARDAFGPGLPRRDLLLSPDHAIYADGVLIPAGALVNGCSIAPAAVVRVTYYHIELARHAILLAEGLPAESFLDTGNRAGFANGTPGAASSMRSCAPLRKAGREVERVRLRLAACAAFRQAPWREVA